MSCSAVSRLRLLAIAATLALLSAGVAPPAGAAPTLAGLPVNQWVELPGKVTPGYGYSAMVYAPGRKQLLHWGAVAYARDNKVGRNDVLAFDAEQLRWVSDYPSDPAQTWGMTGGGNGGAISFTGRGTWLASGRPAAAMTVHAAAWDSRRNQLVYSLPGLMVAYDPAKRVWRDLQAKTLLHGGEFPGGPQLYGAGMAYDPLNDELVIFSHFGAQAADERELTGRVSGHLGTLRYQFKENTWQRAGGTLGMPRLEAARLKNRLPLMQVNSAISNTLGPLPTLAGRHQVRLLAGEVSSALDELWTLRRQPTPERMAAISAALHSAAAEALQISAWGDNRTANRELAPGVAASLMATAELLAQAAQAERPAEILAAGVAAEWKLQSLLQHELAIQPPARAVAPLVLDERRQCLVLFGGDSGRIRTDLKNTIDDPRQLAADLAANDRRLDDTWLYDLRSRQWQRLATEHRPPAQQSPNLVYDPHSGLILLIVVAGNPYDQRVPRTVSIWSLDTAAGGDWSLRSEAEWTGPIDRHGWYTVGLDPHHRLLLINQVTEAVQTTWAMRYDLAEMKSLPAVREVTGPAAPRTAPEQPTRIPPDDPSWVVMLKELPANVWTRAQPAVEPSRRDWGNIACDPVRGWLVYFGGGHSTYQGTDVAVYAVGANRWVHQAGGHNDSLPPVGWGGYHVDLFGGNNAGHMRNQYVALDGRMFVNLGFGGQVKPREAKDIDSAAEIVSLPRQPHAWFYDIDRGGVWRQRPTKVIGQLPESERGRYLDRPHVVDPAGKIYGLEIVPVARYDNRAAAVRCCAYDIYTGATTIVDVPEPWPHVPPESRPFCMLPDRQQIFFQDYDRQAAANQEPGTGPPSRTWVYDIRTNRFIDLKPGNQPPGIAAGTAYLEGQDAVLCAMDLGGRNFQQWIYSFHHNRWARLPLQVADEGKMAFQAPYAQFDYVARYGVLVNFNGSTCIMRPDLERIRWNAE